MQGSVTLCTAITFQTIVMLIFIAIRDPGELRRIAAACLHHGVSEEEIDGRLFVDSGRDTRLVVMREVRKEIIVAEPIVVV